MSSAAHHKEPHMNLITIGNVILNMDNVTHFYDHQAQAYSGNMITAVQISSGGIEGSRDDFRDADADALRAWIAKHAINIRDQHANETALRAAAPAMLNACYEALRIITRYARTEDDLIVCERIQRAIARANAQSDTDDATAIAADQS
jgi:hypothetical protein